MRNYETKIYDYIDKKSGAHIIKATTAYAGKTVSAYSKCDPDDTFNFELGKKIALTRLEQKIALKRAANLKDYAKFCRMNLEFIELEKHRINKALQRAEAAYIDRRAEAKQHEQELAELFNTLD